MKFRFHLKKVTNGYLFFSSLFLILACTPSTISEWSVVEYYDGGKIKLEMLEYSSDSTMLIRGYHENGNIRLQYEYREGLLEGQSLGYHENGSIAEVKHFVNGKLNGLLMRFTEDSKLRARFVYNENKMVDGSFFFDNGQPTAKLVFDSLGRVKSGVYFHPNGNVRSKGSFHEENDKIKHGEWELFHENGILKQKGIYEKGVRRGNWHYYDSLGNETMVVPYH